MTKALHELARYRVYYPRNCLAQAAVQALEQLHQIERNRNQVLQDHPRLVQLLLKGISRRTTFQLWLPSKIYFVVNHTFLMTLRSSPQVSTTPSRIWPHLHVNFKLFLRQICWRNLFLNATYC